MRESGLLGHGFYEKMGIASRLLPQAERGELFRKDPMAAEFWNVKKFNAALSSGEPFLVDFFATWCGPCRQMAPIFEEFAVRHDDIHVAKVDIDAEPTLAEQCGVRSVPTFILFRDGKEISRALGAMPLRKLEQFASVRQTPKESAGEIV